MRRAVLFAISLSTVISIMILCFVRVKEACASVQPAFQRSEISNVLDQTQEQITEHLAEKIHFPCTIPGTTLIAEGIAAYDGPYLEDGTDQEVVNVTGLILRNSSDVGIAKTEVVMYQDGRELIFEADTIPPGATVLILEKRRTSHSNVDYTSCIGWQIQDKHGWNNWGMRIQEIEMGLLEITNQTGNPMKDVQIYYKTKLENIYIGGVTYIYTVPYLGAGETIQISPYHYARGYSEIIKIIEAKK